MYLKRGLTLPSTSSWDKVLVTYITQLFLHYVLPAMLSLFLVRSRSSLGATHVSAWRMPLQVRITCYWRRWRTSGISPSASASWQPKATFPKCHHLKLVQAQSLLSTLLLAAALRVVVAAFLLLLLHLLQLRVHGLLSQMGWKGRDESRNATKQKTQVEYHYLNVLRVRERDSNMAARSTMYCTFLHALVPLGHTYEDTTQLYKLLRH